LLREIGWPFTVFVVTTFIGARDFVAEDEILDMMRNGVRFESHTRTHRRLPALSDSELAEELALSKSELEALLGRPVEYLAYPFGEVDARVVVAAQEVGYKGAFCTEPGFNRPQVDRLRIRRLDVSGTDSPSALARKLALGANDGSVGAMVRYLGRRMVRGALG
jgi:peptidoglycan/xylan/chitin deacetylase (PgdA/CDA1 family)